MGLDVDGLTSRCSDCGRQITLEEDGTCWSCREASG